MEPEVISQLWYNDNDIEDDRRTHNYLHNDRNGIIWADGNKVTKHQN